MNLSIIIIGDEILLGGVTDTNSGLIARKFTADGWNVRRIRTVSDKADDIDAAIRESLAESELVITTGGLGPTRDDITKPVLARIFGGRLTENAAVLENVNRIFDHISKPFIGMRQIIWRRKAAAKPLLPHVESFL